MTKPLDKSFFCKPCIPLAKELIGKKLVRIMESGERLCGIIVETEAYTGGDDPASHSYKGKTARNEAMFMPPGTCYVYNIYGTYCCINVSSTGEGAAVLIRALDVTEGEKVAQELRIGKKTKTNSLSTNKSKGKKDKFFKHKDLCNGPSKLCMALCINKRFNQVDLTTSKDLFLEDGCKIDDPKKEIVQSSRIGIEGSGKESASKLWRFYLLENDCVSRRDKCAEILLKSSETVVSLE